MKEECIVVTWLPPDQPGYLDFAYRIRALARTYRTIVVSQMKRDNCRGG